MHDNHSVIAQWSTPLPQVSWAPHTHTHTFIHSYTQMSSVTAASAHTRVVMYEHACMRAAPCSQSQPQSHVITLEAATSLRSLVCPSSLSCCTVWSSYRQLVKLGATATAVLRTRGRVKCQSNNFYSVSERVPMCVWSRRSMHELAKLNGQHTRYTYNLHVGSTCFGL